VQHFNYSALAVPTALVYHENTTESEKLAANTTESEKLAENTTESEKLAANTTESEKLAENTTESEKLAAIKYLSKYWYSRSSVHLLPQSHPIPYSSEAVW